MAESSDPLLLSKPASKLAKGGASEGIPGTFLIYQSKVKWRPQDSSAGKPTIIEIASITKYQQAPGKPLLRILSSAEPLGLSFASVADKDEVLEFMKQLKPAAPAAAAPSASGLPTDAQKRSLFAGDKDLEALYNQLVVSGILTEADFWRTRGSALARLGTPGGAAPAPKQRSGLSSVMHEVEQLHDGSTERVNIHLTPADIRRIFVERPEVHRAFMAKVPNEIAEADFWQRYFKLEYKKAARRKRLAATGRVGVTDDELVDANDDFFREYREKVAEQEAAAASAKIRSVDPTVNLVAEVGDRFSTGVLGVGQGAAAEAPAPAAGGVSLLESLARDLNRHSAQVLGGAIEGLGDDGDGNDTAVIAAQVTAAIQSAAEKAAEAKKNAAGGAHEEVSEETLREWQARAASALEDLSLENKAEMVPLDIKDARAYFGSVERGAAAAGGPTTASATWAADVAGINAAALPNPPFPSAVAAAALLEAGRDEDEALVREYGPVAALAMAKSPKDALGSVMVEFFRLEALKTNELLRHLWGCMPITSEARRGKASRLAGHLEEQRRGLQAHMASAPGTVQQVYVAQMVRPLIEAIAAGLDRYMEAEDAARRRGTAK